MHSTQRPVQDSPASRGHARPVSAAEPPSEPSPPAGPVPVRSGTPDDRPATANAQPAFARPPRVLVIEDHQDTAELLVMLLEVEGFQAMAVHDGIRAVEVARTFRPTVVLSDLDLPGRDGFALVEQLRDDPEFAHTPIVAVTARVDRAVRLRAIAAGFARFIPKPVEPSELFSALRSLLNRRARRMAFMGRERRA